MAEDVRVTHPIEVQNDARARVAFDLMELISRRESDVDAAQETRDYWLILYTQCWRAANGAALKHVLERS